MSGPRRAEAARWFGQAVYDLKAARWNAEGGFHNTACFLAQQAGEKALKSLLYYLGARRTALLTHSLVEMIRVAGKRVEVLRPLTPDARELDLHYVPSRYPNGLPSGYPHQFYGPEMSERGVAAADRIMTAITRHYRAAGEETILAAPDQG